MPSAAGRNAGALRKNDPRRIDPRLGDPKKNDAAAKAEARRTFTAEIDAVERMLAHLRVDFERYFNGALDLPPVESQLRAQAAIRELRGRVKAAADQFRLGTLEARFNTYNEMFNRRLRDQEEGRKVVRVRPEERPRFDPEQGVLVSGRIDESAAAALYQALYAASSQVTSKLDPERFRAYLDQQAAAIQGKTGCAQVQFRLAHEDGQLKLKAKPIGKPAKAS